MLFTVLCYSLMPLSVVLFGSKEFPFLFNMGWRGGIAIGYALILAVWFRRYFFNWTVWEVIFGQIISSQNLRFGRLRIPVPDLLLVMVAYFNIGLFAMSIRYLDISSAIMMAAISPVVMIFVERYRLFGGAARSDGAGGNVEGEEGRSPEADLHWSRLSFILLGIIGAAFIVFGQLAIADGESASSPEDSTIWLLALGIVLALGSAVIYGLNRRSNTWGERVENAFPDDLKQVDGYDRERARLFCALAAGLIATLVVVPLCLLIGINTGENLEALWMTVPDIDVPIREILPLDNVLILIVAAGGLTYTAAGVAWRRAGIVARNAGINAIEQIRPVFSLLWFLPFTYIAAQPEQAEEGLAAVGIHIQVDYLIIGVIAIVIANLLLNFETEKTRWGFKSLMMALGACGTFVYFRAEIFEKYIGDKFWVSEHYFESVGLAATVFTLLLAFRVANLVSRSHSEETQAFELFRKLEMFVKRGILPPAILDYVIRIDGPKSREDLKEAYEAAHRCFDEVHLPLLSDIEERLALADAEAALDAMARSKQLGLVFGELFALIIFAGLTVFFALLSRPEGDSQFSRFLIDVFAMLISSVTIFLLTNVWDLQRERGSGAVGATRRSGRRRALQVSGRVPRKRIPRLRSVAFNICRNGYCPYLRRPAGPSLPGLVYLGTISKVPSPLTALLQNSSPADRRSQDSGPATY